MTARIRLSELEFAKDEHGFERVTISSPSIAPTSFFLNGVAFLEEVRRSGFQITAVPAKLIAKTRRALLEENQGGEM